LADTIYLPMAHYHDRLRKAYGDLMIIDNNLGLLQAQLEQVKARIRFFKEQRVMMVTEFETAEIALRSAVINSAMPEPSELTFDKLKQPSSGADQGAPPTDSGSGGIVDGFRADRIKKRLKLVPEVPEDPPGPRDPGDEDPAV
jgi:hypothetical protein